MKFQGRQIIIGAASLTCSLFFSLTSSGRAEEKPSRIAIISKTDAFQNASDLLTVELSKDSQLQVLERAEIEKIYREQNLSTENNNFSKLGEILGADGLLLMDSLAEGTNKFLGIRLVAVKPGVVIGSVRSPWPITDLSGWTRLVANRFAPLIPKLEVKRADAIPISVVNLRSAVRNPGAEQLEKELTALVIERLTHESSLFVLERRGMGLLSNEKELKIAGESDFWNGSYLLEGIVDRDGFSPNTLTVSGRLVPPQGEPRTIEISGSRTNLAEAIEQLTDQVTAMLKLRDRNEGWNPASEAQKYFAEANWAIKWGLIEEAQSAADSAWALGKNDLECALIRADSYIQGAIPDTGGYQYGESHKETRGNLDIESFVRKHVRDFPGRFAYLDEKNRFSYVILAKLPLAEEIDRASAALKLYSHLCRSVSPDGPLANSPWYQSGVKALETASHVLQHFYLAPELQKPVTNDLAKLRALARSVAEWLSSSPSVKTTYAEIEGKAGESSWARKDRSETNIYACKLRWSCFWQDKPEETLEIYREFLKNSPSHLIREEIKVREPHRPGLVGWNPVERERVKILWNAFQEEIRTLRPEFRPIQNHPHANSYKDQMEYLIKNTPYDFPRFSQLFFFSQHSKEQATELLPLLAAYKTNLSSKTLGTDNEKAKLKNAMMVIGHVENRLNLIVDPPRKSPKAPDSTPSSVAQPKALSSAKAPHFPTNALFVSRFFPITPEPLKTGEEQEGFNSWLIINNRVVEDRLWLDVRYKHNYLSYFKTNAGWGSRWIMTNRAAAVVFNFNDNSQEIIKFPENSTVPWVVTAAGAGAYTPAKGFNSLSSGSMQMDVVEFFEVFDGALYVSGWDYLRRYDLTSRRWETHRMPWQSQTRLFAIDHRLFSANAEAIFEILEEGKTTKTLASCRRRPATTLLDSLESLGEVTLFSGPDDSLRAIAAEKLFSWNGKEWSEIISDRLQRVDRFNETALIRSSPLHHPPNLWLLAHNRTEMELCLVDNTPKPPEHPSEKRPPPPVEKPIWVSPVPIYLQDSAVLGSRSNLFILEENATYGRAYGNGSNQQRSVVEQDGRHANLFYFERGRSNPCVVPLKFDLTKSPFLSSKWPASNLTWMTLTSDYLLIGQNTVPGIWAIPRAELDKALDIEKQRQAGQEERMSHE